MSKKIYYIDSYGEGKRKGTIGFLRMERDKLEIVLRNVPVGGRLERNIYLLKKEEKQQLAQIVILDGAGQVQIESKWNIQEYSELMIPISYQLCGRCTLNIEQDKGSDPALKIQEAAEALKKDKRNAQTSKDEVQNGIEPVIELDKWKQVYKNFPSVHIFPEAQSVIIKPENMVILHRDYHGLASNSFLLHGYYNYRQLILFYYKEKQLYCIGVPGVYYEREQQIAALYGFTSFENGESRLENGIKRENYPGCFGYYKKNVEI